MDNVCTGFGTPQPKNNIGTGITPLRIAFDLDGVLYDFENCARDWCLSTIDGSREKDFPYATQWKFYEQWRLTADAFNATMAEATDNGHLYTSQLIDPVWIDVLQQLASDGHTIHFITARVWGTRSEENTMKWLRQNKVPYDSITFSTDKTIIDADVLVEDKDTNLDAWFDHSEDVNGIIYDQRYNKHYSHPDVLRAYSPSDVLYLIRDVYAADDTPTAPTVELLDATLDAIETPESILEEAQRLVHGDRGEDYGHPIDNFTHTAALWNAQFADRLVTEFEAEDIAKAMILVKLSREEHRPKRDNLTDIAGYAETLNMVHEKRIERAEREQHFAEAIANMFKHITDDQGQWVKA